jgi:hypothetical protein
MMVGRMALWGSGGRYWGVLIVQEGPGVSGMVIKGHGNDEKPR